MAERVVYPAQFSQTGKRDRDGNEYVEYTSPSEPVRYGEFGQPSSGRCADAKDPITREPYDPARPGIVLQPEIGPGHCFQDEAGESDTIREIWNRGNPISRVPLTDEGRLYLESRIKPPYPWDQGDSNENRDDDWEEEPFDEYIGREDEMSPASLDSDGSNDTQVLPIPRSPFSLDLFFSSDYSNDERGSPALPGFADSEGEEGPPTRRIRLGGALYDWTGGKP